MFGSRDDKDDFGNKVVTQLLLELDELNEHIGTDEDDRDVVIIGATNIPDAIDSSLLRPGRLEKLVYVPPPNAQERADILRAISRKTRFSDDLIHKIDDISTDLVGYTGADIAGLIRQAAFLCIDELTSSAAFDSSKVEELPIKVSCVLLTMLIVLDRMASF